MFWRIRLIVSCTLLSAVAACDGEPSPPLAPAPMAAPVIPQAGASLLSKLVDSYWEDYLALNPSVASASGDRRFDDRLENPISLQYLGDSYELERSALSALSSINAAALDAKSRLDYEIFRERRVQAVRGFQFPQELLPVNQVEGMPQLVASMATGDGPHSFADVKGYEDWLLRIAGFSQWTEQAIRNLREGMRRGYQLPRVVVERLLPQLAAFSQDGSRAFLRPLQQFPPSVNAAERERLSKALSAARSDHLLPAYRRLHDFLRDEYLPKARVSVSLAAMPAGERWYAWRMRGATGIAMTPAQAQAVALADVQRLRARLADLAAQSGFSGNLPGFHAFLTQDPRFRFQSAADLAESYKALQVPVAAAAQFRLLEDVRGADAPAAWYGRNAAGAAVLFVNTADWQKRQRFVVPAGYLREFLPGRHLQESVQREQSSLPRFRRFGGEPGFQRGWAAYAQSLGEELGVYADPYVRIGVTLEELRHALLAVIDTGIHSKEWSRQQAIAYLRGQMPIDEAAAAAEVDGCIAAPADCLGHEIGGRVFREIRARAQAALGAQFDVQAFHAELLKEGAIPLDLLQGKMDRWSKTRVYNPPP